MLIFLLCTTKALVLKRGLYERQVVAERERFELSNRRKTVTHLAGERLQPARPPLQYIWSVEMGCEITSLHFHIKAVGVYRTEINCFPLN